MVSKIPDTQTWLKWKSISAAFGRKDGKTVGTKDHKIMQNGQWGENRGEANKKDFCEGRGHCHLQTIRSKITGPLKSHLDAKQH